MSNVGVKRAVIESTAFLFKDSIIPPANLIGRLFFSVTVADATVMEQIIGESGLDWTIVRPPQLTDGPRTGKYRVKEGHLPPFGFKISRADVADFMIGAVEKDASIRKVVGVSN
jgi:putative NADH-flavin reductase